MRDSFTYRLFDWLREDKLERMTERQFHLQNVGLAKRK